MGKCLWDADQWNPEEDLPEPDEQLVADKVGNEMRSPSRSNNVYSWTTFLTKVLDHGKMNRYEGNIV